jgi:alkylhydroperoxidase family enzyme
VLEDYESAPIDDRLRAALRLLEIFTRTPTDLCAADIRTAMDAGVSKEAIRHMFYVGYLFNTYTRLADTMGWDVPTEQSFFEGVAKRLLSHGYD